MADDDSASYIRTVQHLIEKCLTFQMSQEECVDALSKHANIKPVITATVWKELEKENKEFFEAYARGMVDRASQVQIMEGIRKMVSESTSRGTDK